MPLALGLALALGQAPWALVPIALAGLVTALLLLPLRFLPGWLLGLGYFGWAMQWIVHPFLVDPSRHGWMAPFALLFLAGGLALFWGAAFWAAGRFRLGLPGLVALWAGAEAARSLLFTGLPWALIGHLWIDTPFAQLAAFVGPHGLTLLTLVLGTLAAMLVRRPTARAVPGAAALAALAAVGWALFDPGPAPAADPDAPLVRVVQPNIAQDEKWDPDLVALHVERLLDLTGQAAEGEGTATPALTVWPETAVPWLLEDAAPILDAAARQAQGGAVVLGVQRREDESLYYNSLVLVQGDGVPLALYDKAHLTPFGEYIPYGDWLGRFGIRGLASSQGFGFTPGSGPALIEVPGIGPALPLICYEGIFAEEVNGVAGRARVILLITNDAWFGPGAGPAQHLAQSRLRAIEQGLPVLRAANTGISAIIDARGRLLASLPMATAGALDAPLPAALPPPPYVRLGDWPALALILGILAAALLRRRTEV